MSDMSDPWWNSAQLHEIIPNWNSKIAPYGAISRQVWTCLNMRCDEISQSNNEILHHNFISPCYANISRACLGYYNLLWSSWGPGIILGYLKSSWVFFGSSWVNLGSLFGNLGSTWGHPWTIFGHFGLVYYGVIMGLPGVILGLCWGHLGFSLGPGPVLGPKAWQHWWWMMDSAERARGKGLIDWCINLFKSTIEWEFLTYLQTDRGSSRGPIGLKKKELMKLWRINWVLDD